MKSLTQPPRANPAPESGVALVVVVVFGAGVLVLAGVLLSLASTGVREQGRRHDRRSLQIVLQAGIANAINEINRDRTSGPFDPGGDGVGALLRGPEGGVGVPVRTAAGRLLGRYRVTIETAPTGELYLAVVAAWPDFNAWGDPKADSRRVLSAARVELETTGFNPGGQPLEVAGTASGDETDPTKIKSFKVHSAANVQILAPRLLVPAVRIGDETFRTAFKTFLDGSTWTVAGSDPNNPGSPAAGSAAVSDAPDAAGLSPQSIARLAAGLEAFAEQREVSAQNLVTALLAQGAQGIDEGGKLKLKTPDGLPRTYRLPPGDYALPGDVVLDRGVTLEGEGSLILHKKALAVEGGSRLRWRGDVIVTGDKAAELKLKGGATAEIEGVLAVEGATKKAKLKVESAATLTVTGAALLLSDALDVRASDSRGEVVIKDASQITVSGLFLIVGQHVHFEVGKNALLDVQGSLAFGVPGEASKGIHKFEIKGDAQVKLIHDPDKLAAAVATLRRFTSSLFPGQGAAPFSVRAVSYWEPAPQQVFLAQQARIDAGEPVGIDD